MPGRKFNAGSGYRYGFNGKENDNEVNGEGNQVNFGMRVYDTRIGKFLSPDPLMLEAPESSPYCYADNNPIALIDIMGKKGEPGFTIRTNSGEIRISKSLQQNISREQLLKFVEERVNEIVPPRPKESKFRRFIKGVSNLVKFANAAQVAFQILSYNTSGDGPLQERIGFAKTKEYYTGFWLLQSQNNSVTNSFEIITTDPSTLPDWYVQEVRQRLINGSASSNDWLYKEEIVNRGLLSKRFGESQEFGKSASSDVLGRNLERIGEVRLSVKHAAHHIVAGNDRRAAGARAILAREGIDINDASNGVFLETGNHSTIHTNEYYRKMEDRLKGAGAGNVRKELDKIRTEIKNGTF